MTFIIEKFPDQENSVEDIYITGDFEGWTGGQESFKLHQNSNKYYITIASEHQSLNFKFTKGSWENVETDENGNNIDNRRYVYGKKMDTVGIHIAKWNESKMQKSTASKNVSIVSDSLKMPQLNRQRKIWIYLPPNYGTSKHSYPVLYMHDGQNLFDNATSFSGEWGIDETLNRLYKEQNFELIVVGIDNAQDKRIDEYSPWKNSTYGGGDGDAYLKFIIQTLKPFIDQNYRTLRERNNTGIMGSSMGGLISHYGALKYPEVFGKAGVFSPSFWFSPNSFEFTSEHSKLEDTRLYMIIGSEEELQTINDVKTMTNQMISNGFTTTNLATEIVDGGQHNEAFWKREFKEAIIWLFEKQTIKN